MYAILLLNPPHQRGQVRATLSVRGFHVTTSSDPEAVLQRCATNPPALVLVEDSIEGMTGARFLQRLLNVSWTTSTILISDEEPEVVHDKAEGLGILGSIKTVDDKEGLDSLLSTYFDMVAQGLVAAPKDTVWRVDE